MGRILQHDDLDEHEEISPEDTKSIVIIKIVIIVLLLLAGLFVFFPYSQVQPKNENTGIKQDKKKDCCKGRFFSISNCFAAGMLISMALCHILPESEGMYLTLNAAKEAEADALLVAEEEHAEEDHPL